MNDFFLVRPFILSRNLVFEVEVINERLRERGHLMQIWYAKSVSTDKCMSKKKQKSKKAKKNELRQETNRRSYLTWNTSPHDVMQWAV